MRLYLFYSVCFCQCRPGRLWPLRAVSSHVFNHIHVPSRNPSSAQTATTVTAPQNLRWSVCLWTSNAFECRHTFQEFTAKQQTTCLGAVNSPLGRGLPCLQTAEWCWNTLVLESHTRGALQSLLASPNCSELGLADRPLRCLCSLFLMK